MRRLTEDQVQHKQVLFLLALMVFEKDTAKFNEYADKDEWRLARADATIQKSSKLTALMTGDITIAKKTEDPGAAIPRLTVFSWRTKSHMVLKSTDPIEFLED